MLEKILKLNGTTVLNKAYQKEILGGTPISHDDGENCPPSNCSSDSDCQIGSSYCRSVGNGNCYWKECSPGY
jgi:hypothetical protein